jgi:hypothetical protein
MMHRVRIQYYVAFYLLALPAAFAAPKEAAPQKKKLIFVNFYNATGNKNIAYLESSWEDKSNYIREADRITKKLTQENLKAIAGSVPAKAGDVVVYNSLPWPRSDVIEVGGKRIFVKDVPPSGYKVVSAAEAAKPADVLESPFYKVVLDPASGSISSLVDKRTGREWVDKDAKWKLGQYLNERFTFEQTRDYTIKYQSLRINPGDVHPGRARGGNDQSADEGTIGQLIRRHAEKIGDDVLVVARQASGHQPSGSATR